MLASRRRRFSGGARGLNGDMRYRGGGEPLPPPRQGEEAGGEGAGDGMEEEASLERTGAGTARSAPLPEGRCHWAWVCRDFSGSLPPGLALGRGAVEEDGGTGAVRESPAEYAATSEMC